MNIKVSSYSDKRIREDLPIIFYYLFERFQYSIFSLNLQMVISASRAEQCA